MPAGFRKIAITGGAGYVGTSLTKLLLESGYEVKIIDALRSGAHGIFPFFAHPFFSFVKCDIRDARSLPTALAGADAVIHLAAIVGFPACAKEPLLSRDINVNGTENVLAAAPEGIPVIFASSTSSYGKTSGEICDETSPLNAVSDYGRQKADAETLVMARPGSIAFRFATAFGVSPRMRLDLLPNDFAFRAVRHGALVVYERSFKRTFLHVRDIARSFLFALENYERMQGQVFNAGDNSMNLSKEEVCLMLKKKVDFFLHFDDSHRDPDQRDFTVSYDKISALGFRPTVDMDSGLTELVQVSQVLEPQAFYFNV